MQSYARRLTAECGGDINCSNVPFFIHRSFFRTLIRRGEAMDSRDCASVRREVSVVRLMESIQRGRRGNVPLIMNAVVSVKCRHSSRITTFVCDASEK